MRALRASWIAIVAASLLALSPRWAYAHAFPSSEQPTAGATINAAPAGVEIHFDNPIEAMFARLQVFDGGGADVTSGPPSVSKDGITLSVQLKPLAAGDYTVKWSVVAEDSHRTEGSYTFTVTGH
jgi:methionine-rich copper-binding protein CopC